MICKHSGAPHHLDTWLGAALVVTLALFTSLSGFAADWRDTLSGGLDLRLRYVDFDNAIYLDSKNPGHQRTFERYRIRAWGSYRPNAHLALNARLIWEGRHYSKPEYFNTWYVGGILFDRLNLELDNIADTPLSVTIGRQDLIFGNGWLILEGTPLDGSRTIYFDAVRAIYDAKEIDTQFDLVYLNQPSRTDHSPQALNGKVEDQSEQDEQGAIVYARNKSIDGMDLDGYFIYKRSEPVYPILRHNNGTVFPSPPDDGEIYAVGGRGDGALGDRWRLRAEGVFEWGELNGADMQAFGFNSRATYDLADPLSTNLHLGYEYLSGDDPDSRINEAFDPLWGRWPQWSELYIYTYAIETRIAQITNLQRLNLGLAMKPHPTTSWTLDYHALWANENTVRDRLGFSDDGRFRGHLFTSWIKTKFNEHVSGHLMGEYFLPGDYYDFPRTDDAWFFRAELVLTL